MPNGGTRAALAVDRLRRIVAGGSRHRHRQRALHVARRRDRFALSTVVLDEIVEVLHRPRLARFIDPALRTELLDMLVPGAAWFEPSERVLECRDAKDNKYLELVLAASASTLVSSDGDLLVLHPWRGVRILGLHST